MSIFVLVQSEIAPAMQTTALRIRVIMDPTNVLIG